MQAINSFKKQSLRGVGNSPVAGALSLIKLYLILPFFALSVNGNE